MSADEAMAATAPPTENVHGTTIAIGGLAVLLRGQPGSGKSDLALRCIALAPGPLVSASPMLVADDRTILTADADGLSATCPAGITGLIEVRGLGIMRVPVETRARLVLVVDLVAPSAMERLPSVFEPVQLCGHRVPRMVLAPFEASAPVKLVLAVAQAKLAG
jgi:HPr kinase/phosphorylase